MYIIKVVFMYNVNDVINICRKTTQVYVNNQELTCYKQKRVVKTNRGH